MSGNLLLSFSMNSTSARSPGTVSGVLAKKADNGHAVQTMPVPNGVFGSMAYWNHYVYVISDGDALRQFAVMEGKLSPKAASGSSAVSATPTLLAHGLDDGIVWLSALKSGTHLTSLRHSTPMTL